MNTQRKKTQRTLSLHTVRECSEKTPREYTQRKFREHENSQRTFREHAENFQRTFREQPMKTQRTLAEHAEYT